jgi:tetratricopeptide (TPR) repeat protein
VFWIGLVVVVSALLLLFCLRVAWRVGRRVARHLRVVREQVAAYRRCDYQAQLTSSQELRRKGQDTSDYLYFHGSAQFQLGRLLQAEHELRRSLAMEKHPGLRTICRDELGRVMMEGERWEEAEAYFRECLAEDPRRGAGHRALAELLLRRGVETGAALESARQALALERSAQVHGGKLGKEDHLLNVGESLAVLAWAMARNNGTAAEIEDTLKEAFSACGETVRPVVAALHYFAGQAYAELGDSAESARHFDCAIEVDPVGTYGRLSRSTVESRP